MKIGHPPVIKPDVPATTNGHASAPISDTKSAPAAAAAAGAASSAIPATADASAKIAISSGAKNLLSGAGHADFDAEKVAQVSKSIESGSFKINPEAIADKLIANAKEVLTKT